VIRNTRAAGLQTCVLKSARRDALADFVERGLHRRRGFRIAFQEFGFRVEFVLAPDSRSYRVH
jgi:hypothetical protein